MSPRKAGGASAQETVSGAGGGGGAGGGSGSGSEAQRRRSPHPPQQSQTKPKLKPKAQIPPEHTQTLSSPRLPGPGSGSAEEKELGARQGQEAKGGAETTTHARAQFRTQVHAQAQAQVQAQTRSYTPVQRRGSGEDPVKNTGKRERHDYHAKHGLCFRCGKHGHLVKDHDLGGRLFPQQQQLQRGEVPAAMLETRRGIAAGGGERQGRQLLPQRGRGDQPSWLERERQAEIILDTDTDINITALAKQQVAAWEGDIAREDDRLAEGIGFGFAWEWGALSLPLPTETGTRTQTERQRTQKRVSALISGSGREFSGGSASEDLLGLDLDTSAEQQQQGGEKGFNELMGLDLGGLGIDSAFELGQGQQEEFRASQAVGGVDELVRSDLELSREVGQRESTSVGEDELQERDEEDEGEEVGDEDGDGDDGIVVFRGRGRGKVEEQDSGSRDEEGDE